MTQKVSLERGSKSQFAPADRDALLADRQAHPTHDPIRIAQALKPAFAFANRNSVQCLFLGFSPVYLLNRQRHDFYHEVHRSG